MLNAEHSSSAVQPQCGEHLTCFQDHTEKHMSSASLLQMSGEHLGEHLQSRWVPAG